MKRLFKTKRRTGLVVMLVVVAASAIGAYAYFTSGRTGTGTAKTGTATGPRHHAGRARATTA